MNGLKYALFTKDISMTELSEELGVSPQLVNHWSNQRRNIPDDYLEKISDFLEVEANLLDKEVSLQDKIQIEMQLNTSGSLDKGELFVDIGSTNVTMYHHLETLSKDYQSLLSQYNQEREKNKQHEELIALIHELSGKNKTKDIQKEQPLMNKVFIANFDDSLCTDIDKIIQYQIEIKDIQFEDGACTVETSILGRLNERWTEVLLNETLVVPLELAAKSDGVYDPSTDGLEAGIRIIKSHLHFRYWVRIEKMLHWVKELKNKPDAEPSDLFLIPREVLSIVHVIRENFGDECIISAKWD